MKTLTDDTDCTLTSSHIQDLFLLFQYPELKVNQAKYLAPRSTRFVQFYKLFTEIRYYFMML